MKYAYNVSQMQVEDHVFWAAESSVLDGCVGQGDTLDEAVRELEENETEWLKAAEKYDIPIPDNTIVKPVEYSGKFTVRIGKQTHRLATEYAQLNGISLNQYVNDAIVAANVRCETLNPIVDAANQILEKISDKIDSYQPTLIFSTEDNKIYSFRQPDFSDNNWRSVYSYADRYCS